MITMEVLNRTFFIKIEQYGTGTVVDYQDRQYLVTARHLMGNLQDVKIIKIFFAGNWYKMEVETVGVARGEADLVVFAAKNLQLCNPELTFTLGTNGIAIGQDIFIAGYPYLMHTNAGAGFNGRPCPFVKKGILSSAFDDGTGTSKLYLDILNNEGFSGGPVVFRNMNTNRMQLAGIVSKIKVERESVVCERGEDTEWTVAYNTGIAIAYPIEEAIRLIEANPIGLSLGKSVSAK